MLDDAAETGSEHVKIFFRMDQDEDGYPPIRVESIWARQVSEGVFAIENVPFFVRGIACQDLVNAHSVEGELRFHKRMKSSGHSTIRILFFEITRMREICAALVDRGCSWEGFGASVPGLIAIDVPPTVDYDALRDFLEKEVNAGLWDVEEGCLGLQE